MDNPHAPDHALLIENGVLVEPFEPPVQDAAVLIEAGVVAFAGPRRELPPRAAGAARLDAGGGYVAPGFVDIHVHGGGGADTMDATPEGLRLMSLAHARAGTTALLCTTVTASLEQLLAAERAVVEAARRQRAWWGEGAAAAAGQGEGWGARIAGIHLEGPYLNPERKGAQNPAYMRDPSLDELEALMEASRLDGEPLLRLMTIAPERQGAIEAIRWLVSRGVAVAVGHSAVDEERLEQAIEAGASQVTHLFNGMPPFHHRTPGLAGAALADDRLIAQVIADGVHIHPTALKVAYRARGARGLALVTDALAPMGLGEGRFRLGEFEVEVRGGACRLPNGTLAGSIQGLDQLVRRMVQVVGVPLAEAVAMASRVPAASVGLGGRAGTLRPGAWGDVVVLDRETLAVRATVVAGRTVFSGAGALA